MRPAICTVLALLSCSAVAAQRPPTLGSDPFRVVATMPVRAADGEGVAIRVVDAAGEALAGVDVVVLQNAVLRTDAARRIVGDPALGRFGVDFGVRMFAVGTALGARYVTDADGRTRVAVDGMARAFVAARRVVEDVVLTERAKDREIEVVLALPPAVEVVVTDARGRPANAVPLAVVDADDRFVTPGFGAPIETDRDGRAWVPEPDADQRRDVVALVATARVCRARIEASGPAAGSPAPRVELRLPPCGLLRVYAAGDGLGASRRVTGGRLRLQDAAFGSGGPYQIEAEEVGVDFVTFRWVGVDQPVSVWVAVDGADAGTQLDTTGPALPGEMKVVRMDGVRAPLLRTARLLGPDREPLAAESVMVAITRPGAVDMEILRTDLLGVAELRVDPADQDDDAEVVLVHRGRGGADGGAVRVPVAALRDAGDGDLGDLVLAREPVLAAGRVVDAAGQPLVGLRVRAAADYAIPSDERSWTAASGVGERFRFQTARTDADGRFELRELNPRRASVRLDVELEPTQRIVGVLEHPPGTTGIELVRSVAARVEGSFAALPEALYFPGTLRLVAADGEVREVPTHGNAQDFGLDGVAPGTWAFEVATPFAEEPVHRVEGIEVVAGAVCRDARLQDIDWRAFMRPLRITVTDSDRRPLTDAVVAHRIDRPNGGWRSYAAQEVGDGVHAFFAPPGPARVMIEHPEYRTVTIDVAEDREVELAPRPEVRLHVRNLPDLPAWLHLSFALEERGADRGVRVAFLRVGAADDRVAGVPQTVRPDLVGAAVLRLEVGVPWDVLTRLRAAGARVDAHFERDVEIRGDGAVQALDVDLTADELAMLRDIEASLREILGRDR